MAMQAIIMAGGAGSRLRPMTCACPKPMAALCGASVMDYTLRLLAKHHITSACATLCYRPQDIQGFFGAGRHGVALQYSIEDAPLGTAGSVRRAVGHAQGTVLVLSGDGLTNCDLTAALAFHRRTGAAATLVLKSVDVPLPYGVVVTDERGRILRFIEKPDWSRVVSSLVNTGIYFLEPEALALIPQDKPFDFGHALFPLLLERGLPIYGYPMSDYWCDIGDPAAFLRAQGDMLSGRVGLSPACRGMQRTDVLISADSYVSPQASVAAGAVIQSSCVLPYASIGAGARLNGTIVCAGAAVGRGAVCSPVCMLGEGARAGDFCRMDADAMLWPGVSLPDYAVCRQRVEQSPASVCVHASLARCADPTQLGHLAGAFIRTLGAREVAVMHQGMDSAAYHTLLGALSSYQAQRVWALGRGSAGMLSHAVRMLHADGAVLAAPEGIFLLDGEGLPLPDALSAAVEQCAQRQELPACLAQSGVIRPHRSLRNAYLAALGRRFHALRVKRVTLICKDRYLRALAQDALRLAGHTPCADADLTFSLAPRQARVLPSEQVLGAEQQYLLLIRALSLHGSRVFDTQDYDLPTLLACDKSDACRQQMRIENDGIAQLLLLMTLFDRESVSQAVAQLPALARRTQDVPCPAADKARVLSALHGKASPRQSGGLLAHTAQGRVLILPDASLPLIRVSACAADAESAQELCDLFSHNIKRLVK